LRWAPIHHQGVRVAGRYGLDGRADYLAAIDFDGDWDTTNNWENAACEELAACVYYSVVESATHWFLVYAFYHPRDWTANALLVPVDQHENDLEGALLVVRKPPDGTAPAHGSCEAMITVFHRDFYSYLPAGSPFEAGRETIDGRLALEPWGGVLRPVTAQECEGHGLKAWPYVRGEGVRYVPSAEGVAEEPESPSDHEVLYRLVSVFEAGGLWSRRFDLRTFAELGTFAGDDFRDDAAHAPWGWDDHDDGPELGPGALFLDPIRVVRVYFDRLGQFSDRYGRAP